MKLNRTAYEKLIKENITAVEHFIPKSLEKDHIIGVLNKSVELEYGFKQASEMSEWVSTEDRLPEVETWVSSYIKGDYQKVKLTMFKGNLRWTYFDKSCIYYQNITEVTHWTPLPPQPPKQR